MSSHGRSSRNSGSRRSRKRKEEVQDFQMFIIDSESGDYISPEKVDARGAPKRHVLIVKQNQQYKIGVKIFGGAWTHEVNCYNWYHVELLIDGQHIARRFIQKPHDGNTATHEFDTDPSGRCFMFDTRHDGSRGPSDHIEDEDEVGQIVVRFRKARTVNTYEEHARKRIRRNHDYHKDNQFKIREAKKKRMDIETKEKKSTMRTIFGKATRHRGGGRGGGSGGGRGPPAKIVDGDHVVAECSTMYDSATAFELRNWINPLLNEKFRKYFPERNFEAEEEEYLRNQRKQTLMCDLTADEDKPTWKNHGTNVKEEMRPVDHEFSNSSSFINIE